MNIDCSYEVPAFDVWQIKSWQEQNEDEPSRNDFTSKPNHQSPPFDINEQFNAKICIWSGDITSLRVGGLVHCTNENFTDNSAITKKIFTKAGPELKKYLHDELKGCNTGDVEISSGYNLCCRYILHAVPPMYTSRYHTAAQSSLFNCYRSVLETANRLKISSLALPLLTSCHYPYPTDQGTHIALRTLRWFFGSRSETSIEKLVLVLGTDEISTCTSLLPLYFPRNSHHLLSATHLLPADLGDSYGEPIHPERQIRIIDNPQHRVVAATKGADGGLAVTNTVVETAINVGDHSFTHMEEDVDRQRLLGTPPAYVVDSQTQALTTDLQKKQRYERLLRRAKTEDLREISGIGCLYQCGHDRLGRPVIVFIGKWFKYTEINLEKAMLYLIKLLDPISREDYVIIYFHTLTATENHPAMQWIRQVYDVVDYKLKKNLKAFYIVHPTLWTKIMNWWFTTFMAPQIKHKVFPVNGIEYLYDVIDPDQLEIPAYITEHDMTVNGLRYYKGAS